MFTRRRIIQTKSLKERLLQEARELRDQAKLLPIGLVRHAALQKARQAETAACMDDWLSSPGLRQPTNDARVS